MMDLLPKKRAPSSVLGLAIDGGRLEGVLLRRTNGSLQVLKNFTVSLALNPLTGDPELVGREIRNHLDQAGIRERRCAVCVPLSWALTVQTKVPVLPEGDIAGFLEIEAERGFPYSPDALSVCHSRCRFTSGEQQATLVAIPRNHLSQLEKALKAAQLKPVSFTLGVAALQSAEDGARVLALALNEQGVDLQVTCGGGVAALRAFEGVIETEGVQKRLDAELLAREIRVTLAQLPLMLCGAVHRAKVFGRGDFAQQVVRDLAPRLGSMGLQVELVKDYPPEEFNSRLPSDAPVSPALSLAARCLAGAVGGFEFLPPKTSPWQRLTTRVSSRKLVWAGATAGSMVLLALGAFLAQQWELSRYQSRWQAIGPKVKELETIQQQIKKYRPWFDESCRNLAILRQLTEAFPAEGVVSAKSVEIRDRSVVSCSGTARDTQAFLKLLDQLRRAKEIANLKVDQIRGKTPLQFTFNFQWGEGYEN